MATDVIKPCPHCGGDACITANYNYRIRRYFIFVKCNLCGAQGKTYCTSEDPESKSWKKNACADAVKAWNMRTGADNAET